MTQPDFEINELVGNDDGQQLSECGCGGPMLHRVVRMFEGIPVITDIAVCSWCQFAIVWWWE
jgi:hypothetical protein